MAVYKSKTHQSTVDPTDYQDYFSHKSSNPSGVELAAGVAFKFHPRTPMSLLGGWTLFGGS